MKNQPDISQLHQKYEEVIPDKQKLAIEKNNKIRFPYEFFNSIERGWIPCDVLEMDTKQELVKVSFYNPDSVGWKETCQGGIFDEVVNMWRVRLRED